MYCNALHYTAFTVLHSIALYCTPLHCTALHCPLPAGEYAELGAVTVAQLEKEEEEFLAAVRERAEEKGGKVKYLEYRQYRQYLQDLEYLKNM